MQCAAKAFGCSALHVHQLARSVGGVLQAAAHSKAFRLTPFHVDDAAMFPVAVCQTSGANAEIAPCGALPPCWP
jgi:hypothetical protein